MEFTVGEYSFFNYFFGNHSNPETEYGAFSVFLMNISGISWENYLHVHWHFFRVFFHNCTFSNFNNSEGNRIRNKSQGLITFPVNHWGVALTLIKFNCQVYFTITISPKIDRIYMGPVQVGQKYTLKTKYQRRCNFR